MSKNISISFDNNNSIRILEEENYIKTESLSNECNIFVNSIYIYFI